MAETANKGSTFYLCIRELLDRGEKRLHQIFLDRWSIYCRFNDTIKKWKNNSNSGSQISALCISATKTQNQLLQNGKIELWDISLTYLAIQSISYEIQKLGKSLDATEDKYIRELKEERNKNAHGSKNSVINRITEFELRNFKLAIAWFKRAFENGFAASANYLGALYKSGKGVEKSVENAFQYFIYAARNGNIFGMQNLAHLFFESNDNDEGMKWLQLAAAKGNLVAGRELEKRKQSEAQEGKKFVIKDIEFVCGSRYQNSEEMAQYENTIEEDMMKGSIMAGRNYFIWLNMENAFLEYRSNGILNVNEESLSEQLSQALGLDRHIIEIQGLKKIETFLFEPGRALSFTCTINNIPYKYTRQNPIDEKFWAFLNCSFLVNNQKKCGLSDAEKAVDINYLSLKFLYLHCEVLSKQNSPQCIEALNNFIAIAPEDHEKIPACHYLKAMHYIHMQDSKKFIESYEKGLAAEKLPCFLQYFFPYKVMLDMHYFVNNSRSENEMGDAQNLMNFSINENYEIAILKHRKDFVNSLNVDATTNPAPAPEYTGRKSKKFWKSLENKMGSSFYTDPTIVSIPGHPLYHFKRIEDLRNLLPTYPPALNTLQEITSNDMISDKIYKGYVLKAQIIDWPYFSRAFYTLIQERNNTILKVKIEDSQKQPSKERVKEMIKTFRPNSLISIINPYIKEVNNERTVFVKYSNHVKIDDSGANKKCDFCREKKKTEKCNGCHLSQYCSKNCQKLDSIHLNHASVCDYLKTYADGMK